jgi:uncharacterized protein YyaL (SSP411 family)
LLDLFEVSRDRKWLEAAIALDRILAEHFEDRDRGGFFATADDHEKLLVRSKPSNDGAVPSGNSVHALNLLRLYQVTTDDRYLVRADRLFAAMGGLLAADATSMPDLLLALDFRTDATKQIVIAATTAAAAEPLVDVLKRTFMPNAVLVVAGDDGAGIADIVPLTAGKRSGDGATAYVCERSRCQLPTTDPAVLAGQLKKFAPFGARE